MRNLSFFKLKCDKRFLMAFVVTLICSIICGIVLYKPVTINFYFIELSEEYVFNVFNFQNGSLLLPHFLAGLIYFYIIFFVCYFTKFKYLTLILTYVKGLFAGIYASLLIACNSFGGVISACLVFIPATLISSILGYFIAENCRSVYKKYAFAVPAVCAVADCLLLFILVNILFRIVVAMV